MDDSSANLPKSMEDAIKSVVGKSILTLSNNMTKVLDDSVHSIKRQINEDNETLIEKVVKKARRENSYTSTKKGNEDQFKHNEKVLFTIQDAKAALEANALDRAKALLDQGSEIILKRIKSIKLADRSPHGWLTVNEYLSDDLASDSEDEKRIDRSEKRASTKIKESGKARKKRKERLQSAVLRQIRANNSRVHLLHVNASSTLKGMGLDFR